MLPSSAGGRRDGDLSGGNLVLNGTFAPSCRSCRYSRRYRFPRLATAWGTTPLFSFDLPTFTLHDAISLAMLGGIARWWEGRRVQGTPWPTRLLNEATLARPERSHSSARTSQNESTVELSGQGHSAAVRRGAILSASTSRYWFRSPRPTLHRSPEPRRRRHDAAHSRDLLFISNGEAGVYVAMRPSPSLRRAPSSAARRCRPATVR